MSSKDKRTGWWRALKKGDLFYKRTWGYCATWSCYKVARVTPTGRVVVNAVARVTPTAALTQNHKITINEKSGFGYLPDNSQTEALRAADERVNQAKSHLYNIHTLAQRLQCDVKAADAALVSTLAGLELQLSSLQQTQKNSAKG